MCLLTTPHGTGMKSILELGSLFSPRFFFILSLNELQRAPKLKYMSSQTTARRERKESKRNQGTWEASNTGVTRAEEGKGALRRESEATVGVSTKKDD